ncbi:Adapter molecule Crk, partial [Araneus ventricosus]
MGVSIHAVLCEYGLCCCSLLPFKIWVWSSEVPLYILVTREDSKVSHYIINRVQQDDQTRFRIGDQMFPDVPSLLNFYKLHYLDTTPLIRPAPKKLEKVRAKYDFEGSGDPDDLPFKKGEILTVISKDEDQWWTAKNSLGQTGSIPVPYIEK